MFTSLTLFVYHQLIISSKIIFLITLLQLFLCSPTNADKILFRQNRAIGGESLDASNFVLHIDENDGSRYIEVPYEFMKQWLNDQKMWRAWSIVLIILCIIFFAIFTVFLIHSFRTSSGPFTLCAKHIDENQSDIKMTSSEISDYTQAGIIPIYNTNIDPRYISSLKISGQA